MITKDNVDIKIDGVLFYKIVDAYKSTYNITDPHLSTEIMAQSLLRIEIGKITLDQVLHQRQQLNDTLLREIKAVSDRWGVECYRYEILEINIDDEFIKLMNLEADSERKKRGLVLNAEAFKVSKMNSAEK